MATTAPSEAPEETPSRRQIFSCRPAGGRDEALAILARVFILDEENADAHLKRQVMGREVVVAVTAGKLDFGPWEQIFYGEFDGRRRKRVLVKIIGE